MARRGQTWSVDVVLAVVIFGFIALIFTSFALLNKSDVEDLQSNAERVTYSLAVAQPACGVILANDTINNGSIECLFQQDYEDYKEEIGLSNEFCVYLEDENGQVIEINGLNGWGSSEMIVGGRPCGT